IKADKLKEVTDVRDEIDISGFKLTIDLKKGVDPDRLMSKLYKTTPLEDSCSANFNVLIDSIPRTMGIIEILNEWIIFRIGCVKRELTYDMERKQEKLHLLLVLGKILLDIDKAIKIIRETKLEKEVVPNLMEGFNIDQLQAEYIAEIKLRHLNREHILSRINEIEELQKQIADLDALISSEKALKKYIIAQLKEIKEKYGQKRKTQIIYEHEVTEYVEEKKVENYPVRLVFSAEGYFKKITMQSLIRGNEEQAFKEGDRELISVDGENTQELLFFSDKGKCYKSRVDDFEPRKSSVLGEYVPAKLGFDKDERCIYMLNIDNYSGDTNVVFVFENGKAVKVPLAAYETKSARKKLTGAYSTASPIVAAFREDKPLEILLFSSDNKAIQISSSLIPQKTTKSASGVTVLSLKKGSKVVFATERVDQYAGNRSYKKLKVPATGVVVDGPSPLTDEE
ncbi:MAG: topoisomerase IV, partial [Clostridia bacterium]|nr:topoisomerase IV [Clostridia bacterium]